MSKIKRIATGPDVGRTWDRMVEISALLDQSGRDRAEVEYSALIGLGAQVMACCLGQEPTNENCQRLLGEVMEAVANVVAVEVRRQ